MKPRPKAAPTKPKFWARVWGVETSAMYALAVVMLAPMMPAMMRPRNNQPMLGAHPWMR